MIVVWITRYRWKSRPKHQKFVRVATTRGKHVVLAKNNKIHIFHHISLVKHLYMVIKALVQHTTIKQTGRNGLMESTIRVEKWNSTPNGKFHSEWKIWVEFQIRNSTREWNSTPLSGIPLVRGHAIEYTSPHALHRGPLETMTNDTFKTSKVILWWMHMLCMCVYAHVCISFRYA